MVLAVTLLEFPTHPLRGPSQPMGCEKGPLRGVWRSECGVLERQLGDNEVVSEDEDVSD